MAAGKQAKWSRPGSSLVRMALLLTRGVSLIGNVLWGVPGYVPEFDHCALPECVPEYDLPEYPGMTTLEVPGYLPDYDQNSQVQYPRIYLGMQEYVTHTQPPAVHPCEVLLIVVPLVVETVETVSIVLY